MNHKKNIRYHADLLLDSAKTLETQAARLRLYAMNLVHKLDTTNSLSDMPLPTSGSDLPSMAGVCSRHCGKLDLAIELAYYDANPADSPHNNPYHQDPIPKK